MKDWEWGYDMREVYSEVLQYRGTHADFGYFVGQHLHASPLIANRRKQWGPKKERHFNINEADFRQALGAVAPQFIEEIQGLAEGLAMTFQEAIELFGGYYLSFARSGCSVFAADDYMVRNYDSHPLPYEGHYFLYQPTDSGLATIGPSMQITGRVDGMNEKGLVMAYNYTNNKASGDGFLCNMIGRLLLEQCSDVDEAVALLREIPHRFAFSYILLDPSGVSYVVEASPREVAVRRSQVCTNHFHELPEENRYSQDDSRRRERVLQEKQTTAHDAGTAFRIMNDPAYQVFSYKYPTASGTLHTAAYFPKRLIAWFSLGPKRKPFVFDFHKWLKGQDAHVTQIRGTLAYDALFANMAKQ